MDFLPSTKMEGKKLLLWFRDDDVSDSSASFSKMMSFFETNDTPILLGVIPSLLTDATINRIKCSSVATVGQHGFSHQNFSTDESEKSELCSNRSEDEVIDEQIQGHTILTHAFGQQYIKICVPPFFEISPNVKRRLEELRIYDGFSAWWNNGLSSCGTPDLNAQIDLVNWSEGSCFAGSEYFLHQFEREIMKFLSVEKAKTCLIGIVLHHELMCEEAYSLLQKVISFTQSNCSVKIVDAKAGLAFLKSSDFIPLPF